MLNNDKKTEKETIEKIKEILTSSVFRYRKYPLDANGYSADSTDVVEIVITDELAEFYAENLVHGGFGDVATLQRENEKLRKRLEGYERREKAGFRGYQPTSSIETAPPILPKNGSSAVPPLVKQTISVKDTIEQRDDEGRLVGYLYFIPVEDDEEKPQ